MPTSEELNELVREVGVGGDRQAFAILFKHFAPRLKSYLIRAGSGPDTAEELVQETMVSVWRKAAQFDASYAGATTWIFTIARNLRIDHFRRQGRPVTDAEPGEAEELPDPAPAPDERLHTERRERLVQLALTQLSEEQAQVLRLSFFEQHPHAEIARELGIPLGTVKSRARLAINHLRRLIDANLS